jgi:hypothetical protein
MVRLSLFALFLALLDPRAAHAMGQVPTPAAQPQRQAPTPAAAPRAAPPPATRPAPPAAHAPGRDALRPRPYAQCKAQARQSGLRGADRRRFVSRCQLGYEPQVPRR